MRLPQYIVDSPNMQSLWKETNIIISVLVAAGLSATHDNLMADSLNQIQRHPLCKEGSCRTTCPYSL